MIDEMCDRDMNPNVAQPPNAGHAHITRIRTCDRTR
jgi:hypothetical protein